MLSASLKPNLQNVISVMKYIESCDHGHHVYGSFLSPAIGKQLVCKRQIGNPQPVAMMCGATVVSHVPRRISAAGI